MDTARNAIEPQRPLLLIPGVCGSILHVRDRCSEGEGERVWVTVRDADAKYQLLWGQFDERSGRMECLGGETEVVVPRGSDSDGGLYAISVLDPEAGFAVKSVHYFDAFATFLERQGGYTAGLDLFGLGYDYRQSTRALGEVLLARLHDISRRSGGRKVDLVTHSMGGLLARALLAQAPHEFGALVHTWVAVGCPFGGAPGWGVDALVTGVQFAGSLGQFFFVDRGTSRQGCLQSPAVYEMLPPLDFPYQQPPPQLRIWLATTMPGFPAEAGAAPPPTATARQQAGRWDAWASGGSRSGGNTTPGPQVAEPNWGREYIFELADLAGLLTHQLSGNSVSLHGKDYPLPFSQALWDYAQATHALWRDAKLPDSCRFYNAYGSGLSTPYDVQYGTWWRPVKSLADLQFAAATFSYVDGDMTVPTESATADEGLRPVERAAFNAAHRDLIASAEVLKQVLAWLQAEQDAHDGGWVLVPKEACCG